MSREPSWDLYRTLLAVLREGSLSGAARALGLTQPTVGAPRRRSSRRRSAAAVPALAARLSPTEAALEMRPTPRRWPRPAAALRRAVATGREAVEGTVRVTASEVFGVERLPPILAALRARHPRLTLELVASNAAQDLLRRDADIAVRMFDPAQEALVARRVGAAELGLYATPGYLARRGAPAALDELRRFDLIGFDRETPALRAALAGYPALARQGFAFRADSDLAQMAALRAGFGIGVCQVGLAARARPRAARRLRRRAAGLGGDARGPARQPALPRGLRRAGRGARRADRMNAPPPPIRRGRVARLRLSDVLSRFGGPGRIALRNCVADEAGFDFPPRRTRQRETCPVEANKRSRRAAGPRKREERMDIITALAVIIGVMGGVATWGR